MKLLLIFCALVALVAADFDVEDSFHQIDTDGNKYLTKNEYEAVFAPSDTNGDGMLNTTEFYIRGIIDGMTKNQITYLWIVMDTSRDQQINITEFASIFKFMDSDMDTLISFQEYTSTMYAIGTQVYVYDQSSDDLMRLFQQADANNDGVLSVVNGVYETFNLISNAGLQTDGTILKEDFVKYWGKETAFTARMLEEFFEMFDDDKDGRFGTPADKQRALEAFDFDRDGKVDKDEYTGYMIYIYSQVVGKLEAEEWNKLYMKDFDAKKMFSTIDADGDGKFTMLEMEKLAKEADTNKDGQINGSEFVIAYSGSGFSFRGGLMMFYVSDANNDQVVDDSEVRASFHHEDRNRDGYVSEEESVHAGTGNIYAINLAAYTMLKLGTLFDAVDFDSDGKLTGQEMWNILYTADKDRNNMISEKEYIHFSMTRLGLDKTMSKHMFQMLDANRDGVFGDSTEKDMFFKEFDYDRDGYVTKDEFINAMLWLITKSWVQVETDIRTHLQGKYNQTRAYHMMDNNTDGTLEMMEVGMFMKSMDKNNDTHLSPQEFVEGFMQTGLSVEGALYLFYKFDSNSDPKYTKDQKYTKEEFETGFDGADLNDDKMIDINEFNLLMGQMLYEMGEASYAGYRLGRLFHAFNPKKDGNMTEDMFKGFILYADEDKSGAVSREEFVPFWMEMVGEPKDRSNIMYDLLDTDDDNSFGDDGEIQYTFNKFDYDGDTLVNEQEFLYAMLYNFAEVMDVMTMRAMSS